MVDFPQLAKVAISEIYKKQLWANSIDIFISGAEVLQLAFIQSLEDKYPDPVFPAENTGPQTTWVTGRDRWASFPSPVPSEAHDTSNSVTSSSKTLEISEFICSPTNMWTAISFFTHWFHPLSKTLVRTPQTFH